ncbi:hypothetical protein GVAV_003023 [Gurleya vavrai]
MVCRNYNCKLTNDVFKGYFLCGSIDQIIDKLVVFKFWLLSFKNSGIGIYLNICRNDVKKIIDLGTDITRKYLNIKNVMLGGENELVKIYESKFGKKRYNKIHRVEGTWV